MTSIIVLSWWILVNVQGIPNFGDTVRAEGPYPSQELCRLAGKALMPWDQRFWTAEAIEDFKRQEAQRPPHLTLEYRREETRKCPCYTAVTGCVIVPKDKRPGGD